MNDRQQIADQVRAIVARIGNIDPARITNEASFRHDLGLDSLSLLEAGVDVDYAFKLGIPELDDMLRDIDTLDGMVALVERLLEDKQAMAGAPA